MLRTKALIGFIDVLIEWEKHGGKRPKITTGWNFVLQIGSVRTRNSTLRIVGESPELLMSLLKEWSGNFLMVGECSKHIRKAHGV
jgi:hypothetical protein